MLVRDAECERKKEKKEKKRSAKLEGWANATQKAGSGVLFAPSLSRRNLFFMSRGDVGGFCVFVCWGLDLLWYKGVVVVGKTRKVEGMTSVEARSRVETQ